MEDGSQFSWELMVWVYLIFFLSKANIDQVTVIDEVLGKFCSCSS